MLLKVFIELFIHPSLYVPLQWISSHDKIVTDERDFVWRMAWRWRENSVNWYEHDRIFHEFFFRLFSCELNSNFELTQIQRCVMNEWICQDAIFHSFFLSFSHFSNRMRTVFRGSNKFISSISIFDARLANIYSDTSNRGIEEEISSKWKWTREWERCVGGIPSIMIVHVAANRVVCSVSSRSSGKFFTGSTSPRSLPQLSYWAPDNTQHTFVLRMSPTPTLNLYSIALHFDKWPTKFICHSKPPAPPTLYRRIYVCSSSMSSMRENLFGAQPNFQLQVSHINRCI